MNSEKNYRSVLLELRPRLQSVNAFIIMLDDNQSVNIILETESIQIITDNMISTVPCVGMSIVPKSLSSLKIVDSYITFRFATNNSLQESSGGFKTELLQNTVASIESLSNKPLLSKGVNYTIRCIDCSNSLNAPLKFQRILPLPSDNADPGDWFCHAHGSQDQISLDPKESDIFYTHCYIHINKINILNVKTNDKVVICKFCLNWLGIIFNPNTFRLWFNTVKFVDNTTSISTSGLSDVFHSIKDILKHSLYISVKLMLVCHTSSIDMGCVLIWVVEKKLQILFDGSGTLKKYEVAKVLFKFIKSDDEMFTQWQNDSMVSTITVSKSMVLDVLKHLHKFNEVLPHEFSKSNGFYVSYLFMYDPFVE